MRCDLSIQQAGPKDSIEGVLSGFSRGFFLGREQAQLIRLNVDHEADEQRASDVSIPACCPFLVSKSPSVQVSSHSSIGTLLRRTCPEHLPPTTTTPSLPPTTHHQLPNHETVQNKKESARHHPDSNWNLHHLTIIPSLRSERRKKHTQHALYRPR